MYLPGVDGERQQVLMPEQNLLKVGTVADNYILRAENRARKVTAIGSAENLDQVFLPFEITHQMMNQLNVFHETPNSSMMETYDLNINSKLRAKTINSVETATETDGSARHDG